MPIAAMNEVSEVKARQILSMPTQKWLDMQSEEHLAAFRSLYRDAYTSIYHVKLTEPDLAYLIANTETRCALFAAKPTIRNGPTAPLCTVCNREECTCARSTDFFTHKYGGCWCKTCGYDYKSGGMRMPFGLAETTRVDEMKRRAPDGHIYKEMTPYSWIREPCSSCSPDFVDTIQQMMEADVEERTVERRRRVVERLVRNYPIN